MWILSSTVSPRFAVASISLYLLLLLGVITTLLCLSTAATRVSALADPPRKAKPAQKYTTSSKDLPPEKKKRAPNEGPDGKKYHEIVDLFLDYARRYCTGLGELLTRPGYKWRRRCDVYYESIELFINGFSDTMVSEMDLTQQDMVINALQPMRLLELRGALKAVARRALEAEKTDEKKLQSHLSTRLAQWVMNCAMNKDANSGAGFGMNMGHLYAGGDVNAIVTDEDKAWAAEVSTPDFEDDPDLDNPENMRGGPAGSKKKKKTTTKNKKEKSSEDL